MSLDVAAERLKLWRERPDVMVRELFHVEPDVFQLEALQAFPTTPRIAMKACKGPGKTAVLAWLCWNFLLTRPSPNIAATSITGDNLDDNLWKEMAKWQSRSELLQRTFDWTRTRISIKGELAPVWWMSARKWARSADASQQADTLAGLHADYVMIVLDESGGIPDAVMSAADAIFASCVEGHVVQAGNPTMLEGPLYRAATVERALWHVIEITGDPDDPRRCARVSVEWARQQIEKYGREHPWVLVNVFGKFPPASFNALLGPEDVTAAMGRHLREEQYAFAAKVLGVDVARFGNDSSVLFPRQGLAAFAPKQWRNLRSDEGAGRVALAEDEFGADAVFVDDTGGFGAGWIDALVLLNRSPVGVNFSSKALEEGRFYNRRAEMYWKAAEWVKQGGALPNVPELVAEATASTYTFRNGKILVEEKDQVKMRLGRSPDYWDAFVLTFAAPVQKRARTVEDALKERLAMMGVGPRTGVVHDYDPYADGKL